VHESEQPGWANAAMPSANPARNLLPRALRSIRRQTKLCC
jgi:hypothetical protein